MEELQSSEILEREILEEARKKAARILKTAEDTIQAKNAEWEKKTAETINDLEKKYEEEIKQNNEKLMARLPIDKLRAKNEKIEGFINNAVEAWYHSLNKEQVNNLLINELSQRIFANEEFSASEGNSGKKIAYYSAIDSKDVETIFKTLNINFPVQESKTKDNFPSIILETDNVRIIASIQNLINFYLLEKREELIEAMMGRALLEDG